MLLILKFMLCAVLLHKVSAVPPEDRVIVGFYEDYMSYKLSPTEIPFSKLTHIIYGSIWVDGSVPRNNTGNLLTQVVTEAHAQNVKVLLSFGGFYGSKYISGMVSTPKNRRNFIDKLRDLRDEHKLDGFDIDWQYPGRLGVQCNNIDPENDAANLLKLVQEMRSSFPKKLITLSVRVQPFDGPNGPLKDVSKYAKHVDFINIMAYDINGPKSDTTGPNAPLKWTANKGAPFSFRQSIDAWLNAKFPADKIVMGIPFYGRSAIAKVDMSDDPSNMYVDKESEIPIGDSDDSRVQEPCRDAEITYTGIWSFRSLPLGISSKPTPGNGWYRYFDETSQTPWLFNPSEKKFISYDDPESIAAKVKHTLSKELKGVMVRSLHQDNGLLLDALQNIRK